MNALTRRLGRFAAWGNLLLTAALMLVVWALLVFVASRPALSRLIDLTPQGINSVDPKTEELLRDLREQRAELEFHVWFPPIAGTPQDEAQAQWLAIQERLRDLTRILLRRYAHLAGESVVVRDYDLYGDPRESAATAQAFGISERDGDVVVVAVRMPGRERRFRKLSLLADLAEIDLPGLQQQPGPVPRAQVPVLKNYKGEEGLSSAVMSLLVQGTPVIYFLGGYSRALDLEHPVLGGAYGNFRAGLRRLGFEVRDFDMSRQRVVPKDATVVIVLEPRQEFAEADARALFDYVRRGGCLLLNYSFVGEPDWNPDGGELGKLLGYEVGPAPLFHLVPDASDSSRGADGVPGVSKLRVGLNQNHPVTRRMALAGVPLEIVSARAVRERSGAPSGMRREELVFTGPYAWFGARGDDYRAPKVGLRDYAVGMVIEVDGETPGTTGKVAVIGGMFCHNHGLRVGGEQFGFNLCNWMAERRVLLDIRGSAYRARHLDLKPSQLDAIWWLLVVGVPGCFLLLGSAVFWLRRRT